MGRVAILACLAHVVSSVRRRLPTWARELFGSGQEEATEEILQLFLTEWGSKGAAEDPAAIYFASGVNHLNPEAAQFAGFGCQVKDQVCSPLKLPPKNQGDSTAGSISNLSQPAGRRCICRG